MMLSRSRHTGTPPGTPRRASLRTLAAALVAASGLVTAVSAAAQPLPAQTTTAAAAPVVVDAPSHESSTGVNLFQWTWNSIAQECTSTLGPAGYDWVQTSPMQEHVTGPEWWTSYQPVSYRIESKLGTRAEFAAMVKTCRSAGVKVIADVVINHMSGKANGGTGWAGTPFTYYGYPNPQGGYGSQDFHDCRRDVVNYKDRWEVQNCQLVALSDLRTESEYVRQEIADYMNDLLSLGVSGFRVDAAKHIPAADLEAIRNKLTNRDAFLILEVIAGANEPIQPAEYLAVGDSHDFNYARHLKGVFSGGQLSSLEGLRDQSWLLPHDRSGVFVDNHDTERNGETLNVTWGRTYRLANVFMMAYPYSWPTVYSGYAVPSNTNLGPAQEANGEVKDAVCGENGWTCAHRWNETANMVAFRATAGDAPVTNWWGEGNQIAFGRGTSAYVAINHTDGALNRTFQTSLPAGTYCDVIVGALRTDGTCPSTVTVDSLGRFRATIPAQGSLALHVNAVVDDGGDDPDGVSTVYYRTGSWTAYRMHYRVGTGAWTTAPGDVMTSACPGWVSRTVPTNGATITAAFNDGSGRWDNNGGKDYTLTGEHVQVAGGVVTAANPCDPPTRTSTSFSVQASTVWGQDVYVVGSIPELGGWAPARGVRLSAATYPVWQGTLELPAGTAFEYKYVKRDAQGNVVWESGTNRVATVPADGKITLTDTWR